jgi:hypothetical protein
MQRNKNMKLTKPEDSAAKSITFGIELETQIPIACGVVVGGYHNGSTVRTGATASGQVITAPKFGNALWRAERDGSIRCDANMMPCEFVSPVLSGDEGVAKLREMMKFIRDIGGKVNDSCGCHITVGIDSITGIPATADEPTRREARTNFCRKVAHIAQANAWAIYAQTGTGRHTNSYSHQLAGEVESLVLQMTRTTDEVRLSTLSRQCGRGMVNFSKAFTNGVIEFRAFAGTLNESKVLHHLATVLGICRRAATVQQFGKFDRKATKKHAVITNASEAVRRMWRLLGWVDSVPNRDCALGLFGALHTEFGSYRKVATEMAEQFEQRFPSANL